jgi:hypothetical protein
MRPPRSRNAWRGHHVRTFSRGLLNDAPGWANGVSTSSNVGHTRDRDRDRLSDHDKSIIGQAHQLVGVSGPAAVRAYFGATAISYASTAHAYAEALSQATRVIGNCSPSLIASPTAGPE